MARPVGVQNQDHHEKRVALLEKLTDYVLTENVFVPSLRQMAIAAETSEPTLKHYFENRTGLVLALLKHFHDSVAPLRAALGQAFPTIHEAIEDYTEIAKQMSKDSRYINAHVFGIRESLIDVDIFAAEVRYLVEPGTAAVAERLVKSKGGPVNYSTARVAANMIITNASTMAFRKVILGDKDPVPIDYDRQFSLMANWMLNGLANDPEGTGSGDA